MLDKIYIFELKSPGNGETTPVSEEDIKKVKIEVCEFSKCRKKLTLPSYPCYCGLYFCPLHIPAEKHNCQYNYRNQQKQKLKEELQKVEAEKVRKI